MKCLGAAVEDNLADYAPVAGKRFIIWGCGLPHLTMGAALSGINCAKGNLRSELSRIDFIKRGKRPKF